MPARFRALGHARQLQVLDIFQFFQITTRNRLAPLIPFIQALKLNAQESRLKRIKPGVNPLNFVVIFGARTIVAQDPDTVS